jgi:hypothetical protein
MKAESNLCGLVVWVEFGGRWRQADVITHIRRDRWCVELRRTPHRIITKYGYERTLMRRLVLHRNDLRLEKPEPNERHSHVSPHPSADARHRQVRWLWASTRGRSFRKGRMTEPRQDERCRDQ